MQLRDELMVHGVPFEVFVITPPSTADSEAAPEALPTEAEGEQGTAEPNKALLATVRTRWDAIVSGEKDCTQVCQELVQPPAPVRVDSKGKKKVGKPPAPFILSLAATVGIVSIK